MTFKNHLVLWTTIFANLQVALFLEFLSSYRSQENHVQMYPYHRAPQRAVTRITNDFEVLTSPSLGQENY